MYCEKEPFLASRKSERATYQIVKPCEQEIGTTHALAALLGPSVCTCSFASVRIVARRDHLRRYHATRCLAKKSAEAEVTPVVMIASCPGM